MPLASELTEIREWSAAHIGEAGWTFGVRFLGSLFILIGGIWASRWIARSLRRMLDHAGVQPIVASFTTNLAKAGFIIFVLVAAVANMGFPLTPILAVLGAAGLAVGLALQGTLSNLSSGVLLAILRPFNVGDFIEVGGHSGTVEAVHIFQTRLVTPDHRVIVMPNSQLTNTPLINFTVKGTRRIDLVFDAGYQEDIPRVKDILRQVVASNPLVLENPATVISVIALGPNSVQFAVRPWVRSGDFHSVQFQLLEQVKIHFDAEGIEIPFPQRVVRTVELKDRE